ATFNTNAVAALEDEKRQTQFLLDDLKKLDASTNASTAENEAKRAQLAAKLGTAAADTVAAADAAIKSRDAINELAVQIAAFAAAGVIPYFTAGAGAVALIDLMPVFEGAAVRAATGAVARGVSRVIISRTVKGEGFDVTGTAAMAEFLTGAADGMGDVLAPA